MRMGEERIPEKMLNTTMDEKDKLRTRWLDQIIKDVEMRGGNWEEIQESRMWEKRDGWRFLCKSRHCRPIPLETTYV